MKNLLIKLAWKILYRFSEDYEWVVKSNGVIICSYDGWIENPTNLHDAWLGIENQSTITMERRLKAPVQVRLG